MEQQYTFLQLVFSQHISQIGPKTFRSVYGSLKTSPEQLDELVGPEINKFLTGMDVYMPRVVQFLKKSQTYLPPTTAEQDPAKFLGLLLSERLLLPLLGNENYDVRDSTEIFDLLLAILQLVLTDPPRLRRLARRLGEIPKLLGKVVSALNSDALDRWIYSLGENDPDPETLSNWTDLVVHLSLSCEGGHEMEGLVERWKVIKQLILQLNKLRSDSIEASIGGLECTAADLDLTLPWETLHLLTHLELKIPSSFPELSTLIDHVETALAFDTLKGLTKSLPCRLCFLQCMAGSNHESDDLNRIYAMTSTMQVISADIARESDNFDGNLGVWKIVLSAQALKDLKRSRTNGTFHDIKFKLEDLSSGDWVRRSVATPISRTALHLKVRVFIAYYSNGRILWQIDRGFDERKNAESQVVKVWRIGDYKEINDTLDLVARDQRNWTADRISSCKVNLIDKHHGIKLPATFTVGNDNSHETILLESDIEDRTLDDVLICGKFHRLTTRMIDNIVYGNEKAVFPYDVTAKEVSIIEHDKTPAFIMGRSGTGKTTCLLYKLFNRYIASKAMGEGYGFRQVLLTRSQFLAEKLAEELQQLIKAQLFDQQQKPIKQIYSLHQAPAGRKNMWDGTEKQTTETLFSLLDNNFPLVCTYAHFVKILENTVRTNDRQKPQIVEQSENGELVDFAIFNTTYWPVISKAAPKGSKIDPRVIFSEFMGVIKGLASARTDFAPLSREAYCTRSTSLAPAFASDNERSAVYDLYELYEARKKKRRGYDSMDKMIALFRKLHSPQFRYRLQGRLHEVYVDEVQDQRPIEIEVLFHLVNDPRGVHFAGDSAQCISNDSVFRFENVKALFYEHYSHGFDDNLAKPELFALAHNFRSHQGILSFASFVMTLLWKAFPTMVDKLSPEIGQYMGPRPTIFVGSKTTELLLATARKYCSKQVIIVRDEDIQCKLKGLLPANCVVFTILQSKGMEFDDIFVYEFFSTTPCTSALLRNLEQLLPERIDPTYASKNMAMCSELKSLYVAVTRPRRRLWMLESSLEGNNILDVLTTKLSKALVDVTWVQNDEDVESITLDLRPSNETTEEEWIHIGTSCMERGLLDQAIQCFENAGNEQMILWAKGCLAEETGRVHQSLGAIKLFRESFQEAAHCFQKIKMREKAATCFEIAEDFLKGGEVRSDLGQHEYAGKLFEKGDLIHRAAEEYYKAGMPIVALRLLFHKKIYSKVVQGLATHLYDIDPEERKSLAWKCNSLLREGKIPASLEDRTWNLLISDDEKKEYLLSLKDYPKMMEFLSSKGRFAEGFYELILAQQLPYALETASHADLAWRETNTEYLSEIYNSLQMKQISFNLRSPGSAASYAKDVTGGLKDSNPPWSHTWQVMMATYGNHIANGTVPPLSDKVGWVSDLFTTLVSTNVQHFLPAAKSTSDLFTILGYMCNFSDYLRIVEAELYPRLPAATTTYVGLLTMPWKNATNQSKYLVLSWSYLNQLEDNRVWLQRNTSNILSHARKLLRDKLDTAIGILHDKAKDIIALQKSCKRCAALRVTWDGHKQTQSRCNYPLHWTKTIYTQYLYDLMTVSCMLIRIRRNLQYPKSYGNVTHQQNALVTSAYRYWRGLLLNELCYLSGVQQDATVIQDAVHKIQKEPQYRALLLDLRHRIERKLSLYGEDRDREEVYNESLSTLLRTYRIWYMLEGTNQSQQQGSMVNNLSESAFNGDLAVWMVQQYRFFRSRIHEHSMIAPIFEIISDITSTLEDSSVLHSYNSGLISMFEDMATLLIFGSRRTEIVIPRSWTVLYLQYWAPLVKRTTSLRGILCQRALYRLALSFCKVMINLEPTTKHSRQESEMLLRRSIDFLVIILVNLGNIVPTPFGYHELYGEVQKVLQLRRMNARSIQNLPATKLVKELFNAFKLYKDKDCLLVYKSKETRKVPMSRQLRDLKIEDRVRPDYELNEPAKQSSMEDDHWDEFEAAYIIKAGYWRHCARLKRAAHTLKIAYTLKAAYHRYRRRQQLKKAIAVIQRTCYRFIRDKAHRSSPQSAALRTIQALYAEKGSAAMKMIVLEQRKFLELMIVMVSDGVELYMEFEEAFKRLLQAMQVAREHSMDENYIRELEDMEVRIYEQWKILFHHDGFVAFILEVDELKKICREGLVMAREVKQRLLQRWRWSILGRSLILRWNTNSGIKQTQI